MLIKFRPAVESDLQEIGDYIAEDNPNAAIAFIERLTKRCHDLADFPNVGRKRGSYRTVTEGHYVILYRIPDKHTVEIHRILHGRRNLRKLAP